MSYAKQDTVLKRLQGMNLRALRTQTNGHKSATMDLWQQTRRSLMADVHAAYTWTAPTGAWDLTTLQAKAWHGLVMRINSTLQQFHKHSTTRMRMAFKELRGQSALRHAWALDQVTPERYNIVIPKYSRGMHEAETPPSSFEQTWSEWVGAYDSALARNLRMNALNEGSLTDAMAEVDATRANTPAYTLESALDRLFEYNAQASIAEGMADVVGANGDAVEEEIWRTQGDLRVCDDCDANEGLTAEEADGSVPLHPNCNCFYQLVPSTFAELLRSGDEEDNELAREMDFEGIAPNALVLRTPEGEVTGKAIVGFDEWLDARGSAVAGR